MELNRFLDYRASIEDEAQVGPDENLPPSTKRKAPRTSTTASQRAAKVAKPGSRLGPGKDSASEDFVVDLDGPLRRATVKVFKGNVQVDLREFYEVNVFPAHIRLLWELSLVILTHSILISLVIVNNK